MLLLMVGTDVVEALWFWPPIGGVLWTEWVLGCGDGGPPMVFEEDWPFGCGTLVFRRNLSKTLEVIEHGATMGRKRATRSGKADEGGRWFDWVAAVRFIFRMTS